MSDWLYPANTKFYDVLSAFKKQNAVWPINTKIEVGDAVYIYLAAPYKRVGYICSVKETDIAREIIKEYSSPYIKNTGQDSSADKPFMLLGDIQTLLNNDNDALSLAKLKENGLKGMLMGARKLDNNPQLREYLRKWCIC